MTAQARTLRVVLRDGGSSMTNQPEGPIGPPPVVSGRSPLVTEQYLSTMSASPDEMRLLMDSELEYLISEAASLLASDHARDLKALEEDLQVLRESKKRTIGLLNGVLQEQERSRNQGP